MYTSGQGLVLETNVQTGAQRTFNIPAAQASALALSGGRLYVGGEGGIIGVVELASGIVTLKSVAGCGVYDVVAAPDGLQLLATCSLRGTARLLDAETLATIVTIRRLELPWVSRICVDDTDGYRRQSSIPARLGSNRPPVVEKHLQRAPHRHPASDHDAVPQNVRDTAGAGGAGQHVGKQAGSSQKAEADKQADTPAPEELAEPTARSGLPPTEELSDRFSHGVGIAEPLVAAIDVDPKSQWARAWRLAGPIDDELLRCRVKLPLMEGRGIDGVEEPA